MRRVAAAFLLLAACGSSRDKPEPLSLSEGVLPGTKGAAIELPNSREFEEIARLEDARSLGPTPGDLRLIEFLQNDKDRRVRARAATALGRFPYPRFGAEVTEALVRALEDPDLEVRLATAFALGVRGDPSSSGTLLAYRNDPDPALRARVVEAASRLPDPSSHAQILLSLRDADLGVRMEAAVGAARWDVHDPDASEIDRALLDALHPYRITPESTPKSAVEAELVWRILWALGRRKAELGRGPFLEYATSDIPLERLFALRGLAALPPDPPAGAPPGLRGQSVRAAVNALAVPKTSVKSITSAASDWRVAYEATVALGRFAGDKPSAIQPQVLAALRTAAENESAHVRAGAMEALGRYADGDDVLGLLQRGRLDLSASVRAATLRARARLAQPGDAFELVERGARDDDPVVRAAAADAAGELRDARAGELLLRLARDPSLYVATRAVEELGQHPSEEARASLHGFLAHADNGMRLGAVLALRAMPAASDVGPLGQAYASTSGDVAAEVAFNCLQALAALGGDEARKIVEDAQSDARPYVRAVAKKLVAETFKETPLADEPAFVPDRPLPVAGKDYPNWRFDPMVQIETSRGTMVFELFPEEAPVHVHNFITLAERGAFDGLTFHRVVPDFVIQGGDYRGDGNGAKPYAGEALRAEFTPRKSTRGSLGMPRNDDPDSGGSQFFVTHLPTPHLDGRYTFFGELRTGGDVLDHIEVGDRILSARLLR